MTSGRFRTGGQGCRRFFKLRPGSIVYGPTEVFMSSETASDESSTAPADDSTNLAHIVEQNIDRLVKARLARQRDKSRPERIADLLTKFSGSMLFVYVHAIWFGVWIALNVGLLGRRPFDPFPFSLLTL